MLRDALGNETREGDDRHHEHERVVALHPERPLHRVLHACHRGDREMRCSDEREPSRSREEGRNRADEHRDQRGRDGRHRPRAREFTRGEAVQHPEQLRAAGDEHEERDHRIRGTHEQEPLVDLRRAPRCNRSERYEPCFAPCDRMDARRLRDEEATRHCEAERARTVRARSSGREPRIRRGEEAHGTGDTQRDDAGEVRLARGDADRHRLRREEHRREPRAARVDSCESRQHVRERRDECREERVRRVERVIWRDVRRAERRGEQREQLGVTGPVVHQLVRVGRPAEDPEWRESGVMRSPHAECDAQRERRDEERATRDAILACDRRRAETGREHEQQRDDDHPRVARAHAKRAQHRARRRRDPARDEPHVPFVRIDPPAECVECIPLRRGQRAPVVHHEQRRETEATDASERRSRPFGDFDLVRLRAVGLEPHPHPFGRTRHRDHARVPRARRTTDPVVHHRRARRLVGTRTPSDEQCREHERHQRGAHHDWVAITETYLGSKTVRTDGGSGRFVGGSPRRVKRSSGSSDRE